MRRKKRKKEKDMTLCDVPSPFAIYNFPATVFVAVVVVVVLVVVIPFSSSSFFFIVFFVLVPIMSNLEG